MTMFELLSAAARTRIIPSYFLFNPYRLWFSSLPGIRIGTLHRIFNTRHIRLLGLILAHVGTFAFICLPYLFRTLNGYMAFHKCPYNILIHLVDHYLEQVER